MKGPAKHVMPAQGTSIMKAVAADASGGPSVRWPDRSEQQRVVWALLMPLADHR